jgi:hypothetical protein
VALEAAAGLSVLVPTLGAGATVGLPRDLGAGLRWDTYAGLAHVVTASARARVAEGWAVGLDGGWGTFVSGDLFGVELDRSPFARGWRVEPLVAHVRGRVGLVLGTTVRLTDPGWHSVKLAATVDLGPVFLRAQALVPLEDDTRVLGYLPMLVIGKTFGVGGGAATIRQGGGGDGPVSLRLLGGVAVLGVVPALPPAPLLTAEAQLAVPLHPAVELRARYATHLGVHHRLGPELRVTAARAGAWSFGARLHPSVRVGGTPEDIAGDVSTQAALVLGWRGLSVEAGATVQWLLWDPAGADDSPYLAFIDLAGQLERALASGTVLTARLELAVPRGPDDPFAVLGVYPRLLVGAAWRL